MGARTRSRTRSLPTTRLRWNLQSRTPSNGSTLTQRGRKRSTKKNGSPSKVLQCRFFRKWQELEACPEECQVVVCPTWEEVPHPVQTQALAQPSRRSIKI